MRSRNRMVHGLTRLLVAGALMLVFSTSVGAQEKTSQKPKREPVKLAVENNNFQEMHVYAMRDGFYWSLGVVTGLSQAQLSLPAAVTAGASDFEILADPIGSYVSYQTDPIVLGTNDEIDLTLENNLVLSSYMLKHRVSGHGSD